MNIVAQESNISKAVAPEDLREGDYVCALGVTCEVLPCFSMDDVKYSRVQVVRLDLLPWCVEPRRVVAVCLPYVLVEDVKGVHATLDLRRWRLARVTEKFGKKVFKKSKREVV